MGAVAGTPRAVHTPGPPLGLARPAPPERPTESRAHDVPAAIRNAPRPLAPSGPTRGREFLSAVSLLSLGLRGDDELILRSIAIHVL